MAAIVPGCASQAACMAIFEREGSGDHEGRELAQGVSGDGIGLHVQGFGHDDRMEEYGGLGDLGLLQLLVRTGEHDVGDAEPEDFVGLLEELLRGRNVVVKVLAHADGLSSLTRKYVCVFHNFLRFLRLRGQRYEFIF